MTHLEDYGFTHFYREQTDAYADLAPARVTAVHREMYQVISEFGETNARLAGAMFHKVQQSGDFPAVGDFVLIKFNPQGDSVISKVLDRKSKFSRPDYSGHAAGYAKTILEQVVAANFDYVFILASLNHDLNVNRIQRYLSAAWQSGATPVVVLTKADLMTDFSQPLKAVQQAAVGADVAAVSAVSGAGLADLSEYLQPTKTIVFLGSSGVGKSSLVNALAGKDIMAVNTIREDDSKGRHTTTHRQLIRLPGGAMIIDTPGMRELGMWDSSAGVGEAFADVEAFLGGCKFSDCKHENEPGCAVTEAIANGKLSAQQWQSYLGLKKEVRFTEDKAAFLRDKEQWHKSIALLNKQNNKNGGRKK